MKEIDYDVLLDNVKKMINLLEYDSMRSSGKAKMNAATLESLFVLETRYESKVKSSKKE